MTLNYITCSGTNEFTNIKELVEILQIFPLAEIGVQVSDRQSPAGSARLVWVQDLANYLLSQKLNINAALHVNCGWVEEICRGNIVPELQTLLNLHNIYGTPLFKRIQLNFKLGRDNVDSETVAENLLRLQKRINRRFIISHNPANAALVQQLFLRGLVFDCLFDSSFGRGIAPNTRQSPVFKGILQGYSGGITPNNVAAELQKVAVAVDNSSALGCVYIDAQKGLEDEATHLSLLKCYNYLFNATKWYEHYLLLR